MSAKKPAKGGKKAGIILGIVIPLVVGVLLIWYFNRSKKQKKSKLPDSLPMSQAAKPIQAASSSDFPLKSGSNNDMVRQLQNAIIAAYGSSALPKYGADGDWGSETATAVRNKLGITQLNGQDDFDKAISKLQNVTSTSNNISRANSLVSQWKGNENIQLMGGLGGALITEVAIDAYGAINPTGKQLFLGSNKKYPRDQYALSATTQNGYVLVDKLTGVGGAMGKYKVLADDITVG